MAAGPQEFAELFTCRPIANACLRMPTAAACSQIQITMYGISTSPPQCYLSGQALSISVYFNSATDSVLFR